MCVIGTAASTVRRTYNIGRVALVLDSLRTAMATAFLSWQSDRDSRTGRNLVERALELAISRISKDINLFGSNRNDGALILDRDTRNVAGSPPIVETIFKKIDSAAVFVADLTFVGTRIDRRPTPNPNVLIEYGWALKVIGHSRIIGVMNTAYGEPSGENMPFDLRHQQNPITYFCPKRASFAVTEKVVDSLAQDFESALRTVFSSREYRESAPGDIPIRLNCLLEQINVDRYEKVRPSHIAHDLGKEDAVEVENWFLGKRTPTFADLSAIAELYGIEPNWLQHGDGHIYPVDFERLPRNPFEAEKWLINWESGADTLEVLHLIRELDDTGSLYIVKKSKRGRYQIYHTPIHISEMIGTSGEVDLMHLFITLELLYKRPSGGTGSRVVGHQLKHDDISLLVKGNTNPEKFLKNGTCTWWEDIWDQKMSGHDYWPGYEALRARIERGIATDTRLTEWRENIRTGKLSSQRGTTSVDA